uniref:Uncharacterized protein n=1 Tax=Timema tahoe TaxID=61484 RepID=A0A7R9ILK3_9NEOP|nr:unnamed protein product [Timema tahoe]
MNLSCPATRMAVKIDGLVEEFSSYLFRRKYPSVQKVVGGLNVNHANHAIVVSSVNILSCDDLSGSSLSCHHNRFTSTTSKEIESQTNMDGTSGVVVDLCGSGGLVVWIMASCYHCQKNLASQGLATSGRARSEFFDPHTDGSYKFSYSTGDVGQHYHSATATADNTVSGVFGHRDPATGRNQNTKYTAGRRGFRAQGPHIARKMDLSQNKIPYSPPVDPNSPQYNPSYDTYSDPNEDPSYEFGFRIPGHSRQEKSDSRGHVDGHYSFVDDVGLRHDVQYEAGARTGFQVKTPFPDSNSIGNSLFYRGPPSSKTSRTTRGHTSIQRFQNGAYRFTAVGPDQHRTEESDATGHVRGSYTYLDDKGVKRTTVYIAGPNIGYKVLKSPLQTQEYPSYRPPPYQIPQLGTSQGNPSKGDDIFDLPDGLNTAETSSSNMPLVSNFNKNDKDDEQTTNNDSSAIFGSVPSNVGNTNPTNNIKPVGDGSEGLDNNHRPLQFGNNDDDDDIFGGNTGITEENGNNFKPSYGKPGTDNAPTGSSDSGDDFLTTGPGLFGPDGTKPRPGQSGSKIPYGDCCSLSGRGNVRYKSLRNRQVSTKLTESRKPFPQEFSHREEDGFLGFPSGVSVRAHVQSLDIMPFGSRLPPPGVALDYLEQPSKTRETGSTDNL